MVRQNRCVAAMLAVLVSGAAINTACADLIRLGSGGELRGKMDRRSRRPSQPEVTINTLSGAVVVVEREQVQFITPRPLSVEEYETRVRSLPDEIDAHWELATWCFKKNLKKQRRIHLERIVELDPNHARAHRGLGHVKQNGEWISRDELMLREGYVKHKGRYVTPQELEFIELTAAQRDVERRWYKKIRTWRSWLTNRNRDKRQRGLAQLLSVTEPEAVAGLVRVFSDDKNKQQRQLYVKILAQIPGAKPVAPLVKQSLHDVDSQVRFGALNAIPEEQYTTAARLYAVQLTDKLNDIVRRAAVALRRVGNPAIVPNLIDALVTTHTYRVRVPSGNAVSFSKNGSSNRQATSLPLEVETKLRTGQYPNGVIVLDQMPRLPTKLVTTRRRLQNLEVLTTLQELTGQSFGYDARSWSLWWASHKSSAPSATVP
jgi:hypothetical protein